MSKRRGLESEVLSVRRLQRCGLIALIALVLAGSWGVGRLLERADLSAAYESQRTETFRDASLIRVRMEALINSTFYLVAGMVSYIQSNPDLDQRDFARIAKHMYEARPGIRNIAAAPDLVMRFVYPSEGNEAAMGLDYAAHPEQREAALRVRASGEPVIAGPVRLVQGGQAFIGRFPVFLHEGEERRFWGIVSTPVDTEFFYRECGLIGGDLPIEVALRGADGEGAAGAVFFGDPALFEKDSVLLPVSLVAGSWQLAAAPKGGWIDRAPNAGLIRTGCAAVGAAAILIVVLGWLYLRRIEAMRAMEAEASLAKSRFLGNMSHEIRTPLNGILGVAQLIRDEESESERNRWIDTLLLSGSALSNLLGDLLELSKPEPSKQEIELRSVDLRSLLEEIWALVRVEAEQKRIRLVQDGPEEGLSFVKTDPVRLRQILWNLVSNAVKFTSDGEVRLAVSRDGQTLRITVSDTGIGISEDRLEAIFGEFVQEDPSTTRKYGGAGLGLSIARRLARQLGGDVTASSEKGKGSRFTVEAPVS